MPKIGQPSFSRGEISPALHGRVDTEVYRTALATARNTIVHPFGGVSRRPGTRYVGPVKNHTDTPRLVEFSFKTVDKYILEFGDQYIRFILNGGHVLESRDFDITNTTRTNPVVVTAPGHDYIGGETVLITGVVGMTELNDNEFTVANPSGDTFELSGEDGTAYTPYVSGGLAEHLIKITNITSGAPAIITAAAHGFQAGDEVVFNDVRGPNSFDLHEINGMRLIVSEPTTNTFQVLNQFTGESYDTTDLSAYDSGGIAERIYEISTPYNINDVFDLSITQSADVMTIAHQDYPIYELSRFDDDLWTLEELEIGPIISAPADQIVTVITSGSETDRYRVTTIERETQEESFPGLDDAEETITDATQADPVVITAAAHGLVAGDEVQIDNVVGMTELNQNRYVVANEATNTFELTDDEGNNIDGTAFTAYVSGGIVRRTFTEVTTSAVTRDNVVAWSAVSGAGRYAVYRQQNGIYGLIGETEELTFIDKNIAPDVSNSPPEFRDPFKGENDQPGGVGYYEQRRVFGGSKNTPDTNEFSQTGNQSNFAKSRPVRADDAITSTLTSLQVNEIRHYVSLNDLHVFTSGSEWRINAGPDQSFQPDTVRQFPQSYWGSSRIQPVIVGSTVVYCPPAQNDLRSYGYSLEIDAYSGSSLSILANHLLNENFITSLAYSRTPDSRVYMTRDDGKALTMTFDQNQEIIAWTNWDTNGQFAAVAVERAGGADIADKVYFVVRREINAPGGSKLGTPSIVRYIEFAEQRFFENKKDVFFVDSGLSLDNPWTISDITLTRDVNGDVTEIDFIVPGSDAAGAVAGWTSNRVINFDNIIWNSVVNENGTKSQPIQLNGWSFPIVSNTETDSWKIQSARLSESSIDLTNWTDYRSDGEARIEVFEVSGLHHLNGETVKVVGDGKKLDDYVVTNGKIEFDIIFDDPGAWSLNATSRIHIGLPFITDIETLNLEGPRTLTQGTDKKITHALFRFYRSAGASAGPDEDSLFPMKWRDDELMGDADELRDGDIDFRFDPSWNTDGRVFIRQEDAFPLTLVAVFPTIEVGDD